MPSDVKTLESAIRRSGYQLYPTAGGHKRVVDPDTGATIMNPTTGKPVVIASTPSDRRWWDNAVTNLRQAGVLSDDPRKTGQRGRTVNRDISDYQKKVTDKINKVFEALGGIEQRGNKIEVIRAIYEDSNKTTDRHFKSLDSCNEALRRLLDGVGVGDWALTHFERTADSLLAAPPTPKPVAPPKATTTPKRVVGGERAIPAPLRDALTEIAQQVSNEKGGPQRTRGIAYGTWSDLGRFGFAVAAKHNLPLNVDTTIESRRFQILGARFASAIKGLGSRKETHQLIALVVAEWANRETIPGSPWYKEPTPVAEVTEDTVTEVTTMETPAEKIAARYDDETVAEAAIEEATTTTTTTDEVPLHLRVMELIYKKPEYLQRSHVMSIVMEVMALEKQ